MIIKYDNALSLENCGRLITLFEKSESLHERYEGSMPQWTELNLSRHRDRWSDLFDSLTRLYSNTFVQYITETNAMCPRPTLLEEFRMKRYENDDRFDLHTDVINHATAKRYLVGMLYLNTPEGGSIEFPQHGLTIEPTAGDFLVFPCNWCYPHIAHPTSTIKYCISSYSHYE